DRVGSTDCPLGYVRDINAMGIVLCKKGADEMVKVGVGPMAFWIDRYEASLWDRADGTGNQYGLAMNDLQNAGFDSAAWTKPVYAVSRSGVLPATYLRSYERGAVACRLSGKVLPTYEQFLVAAHGTPTNYTIVNGNWV